MLPVSLVTHPGLTDCDVRVLLVLDQLAWREGNQDGTTHASNKEISDRLGKPLTTVRDSLRRMFKLTPPIIERDMLNSNTRDGIRLAYDRTGKVVGPPTTTSHLNVKVVGPPTPPCRPTDNPPVGQPTTLPIREKEEEEVVNAREPKRPQTLGELQDWAIEFIDEGQDVGMKLRGWVATYGVSDTFDALMTAWASAPTRVVTYVNRTLQNWHAEGKLPSKQPKANPPIQAVPLNGTYSPAPAAKLTKGQRDAAELDRQREIMRHNRMLKEAAHGQG